MRSCYKAAWVKSCTHVALMELIRMWCLWGKFYWPKLSGVPENPNHHYFRAVWVAQNNTDPSSQPDEGAEHSVLDSLGCMSLSYQATQWAFNICRLCDGIGHWIRKCEEPHNACWGPFCWLRCDHPGFYFHKCQFLQQQIGKRGNGKCKQSIMAKSTDKVQCLETLKEGMRVDNGIIFWKRLTVLAWMEPSL